MTADLSPKKKHMIRSGDQRGRDRALTWSSCSLGGGRGGVGLRRGGGAEEGGLLHLELVELLLAVHLDDEGDDEDEKSGAGDPGSLAGAPEELLRHGAGLGGRHLAPGDDPGLRDRARHAGQDALAGAVGDAPPRKRSPSTRRRRRRRHTTIPSASVREQAECGGSTSLGRAVRRLIGFLSADRIHKHPIRLWIDGNMIPWDGGAEFHAQL